MITLDFFKEIDDEEFVELLGSLSEQEQMVLMLLRGIGTDPMDHETVAGELGITASEVRDLEVKALDTIERLNSGWKPENFIIFHEDGSLEQF